MRLASVVYNQVDYGIALPIIPRITVQPIVSVLGTYSDL